MQSPFDSPLSGFRSPFAYGRRLGFSIAALFANSEQGVWFAPDPNTCFTDTTGTTAAGVGDAVALMLDGSQGASYKDGEFTGFGPELITNGGFDSDISGWNANGDAVLSWDNGEIVAERAGTSQDAAYQVLATTVGKTYRVSFSGSSADRVIISNGNNILVYVARESTSPFVFTADSTLTNINLQAMGGGAKYDNISVRELPGLHAKQPTAAARPILARVPDGGRRNELTYSEDAASANTGRVTITTEKDGIGDGVAQASGETNPGFVGPTAHPYDVSNPYTFTVRAKADGKNWIRLQQNSSSVANTTWFDVANGVVGTSKNEHINATITPADDGYFDCSVSTATGEFSEGDFALVYLADADNTSTVADDGLGVLIAKRQLELGTTATAYQKVTSTYDVTEAGKADRWYLFDDAVDDVLNATLPDLGTDATVAYASDLGVTILTGQTIGAGDFDVLRDEQLFGMVVVDRALTASETANITNYLEGMSP